MYFLVNHLFHRRLMDKRRGCFAWSDSENETEEKNVGLLVCWLLVIEVESKRRWEQSLHHMELDKPVQWAE